MKYCKKHKQYYYGFLNKCPICVGEKYKPKWLKEKIVIEEKKNE